MSAQPISLQKVNGPTTRAAWAIVVLVAGLAGPTSLAAGGIPEPPGITPAPAPSNLSDLQAEEITPGQAVRNPSVPQTKNFSREPTGFRPWWEDPVMHPLQQRPSSLRMELEAVILGTLYYSPTINVLRYCVPLSEQSIVEKEAEFDQNAFMESKFLDTSDPVGSILTTGGPDRWIDQNWMYSAGLRRRWMSGAQVEVSQKIGWENSNSLYFLPPLQGTGRLSVSLTQPLLRGMGRTYNSHLIVIAQIDALSTRDEATKDLQEHLQDVYKTYWELYLQRALLLQKRRLYKMGVEAVEKLEGRTGYDVSRFGSQMARSKATVATRYGWMIDRENELLKTENKLRTLIGDPNLLRNRSLELIPAQKPFQAPRHVRFEDSLILALKHRPEIDWFGKKLKAACVGEEAAKNELRPVLNLILTSYVSGLEGNSSIGDALADQFRTGRPTYSAGLAYEYPLGNRAAQAKLRKRQLEVSQLTCQLAATTLDVRRQVYDAVRDLDLAYHEMMCQAHAILGYQIEVAALNERWDDHIDDKTAEIWLDDLLNAQDRLARSEESYASAVAGYNIGFTTLSRATGTLAEYQLLEQAIPLANASGSPPSLPPSSSSLPPAYSPPLAPTPPPLTPPAPSPPPLTPPAPSPPPITSVNSSGAAVDPKTPVHLPAMQSRPDGSITPFS